MIFPRRPFSGYDWGFGQPMLDGRPLSPVFIFRPQSQQDGVKENLFHVEAGHLPVIFVHLVLHKTRHNELVRLGRECASPRTSIDIR